ncbi:MAG: 2-amino-4-hydroxy-6-hydroxymethyldihydropteridine diphosphokinase [Spirochaetaceae bacterium]|nr:2-amino-4-hydroxy-6-hydroxymethyldihydropteridine diphosphokinase [Spirochaetaceae bacterium]
MKETENWREALYTKTLHDELLGLERRRKNSPDCSIAELEGTLKHLWTMEGADWLGRGEVQDLHLSATIAAHEEFLSAWKAETQSEGKAVAACSGKVVLGLGSNKGDSVTILQNAINDLRAYIARLHAAAFYRSAPMHIENQPDFFNTAVCGAFEGAPHRLLEIIHRIEAKYGRDRQSEIRWGQRSLDIDILLFGDSIIKQSDSQSLDLEIPHPRLKERRFALEPLLELEPDAIDPLSGERYADICARLSDQGVRRL